MKEQQMTTRRPLTGDTAMRTCNLHFFAMRKSAIKCQMSNVKCCHAPRGFTLVETLVAIAILLVAVVGPISLIGNALHNLYYAKDEMIAIHLAQEGIEVVRQVRDSNMLDGAIAWDTGIASGNYIIDAKSDMPVSIYGGGPLPQTVYTDAMGVYNQSAGTATQFKRIVTTSNVDIGVQIKVISTVTWKTGGHEGYITATDYLFRWAL